jgi:hypothetical protein
MPEMKILVNLRVFLARVSRQRPQSRTSAALSFYFYFFAVKNRLTVQFK